MICSSVYLLFFMSVILEVDGLRYLYSGTAGREQVKRTTASEQATLRSMRAAKFVLRGSKERLNKCMLLA